MKSFFRRRINCWAVEPSDASGVLIDAQRYYRAFVQAALTARRSIYIAGWEFESKAEILPPDEAAALGVPARFLDLLNDLCQKTPSLEIFVLAWDFSGVYAADREWFQEWVFSWKGSKRLHFRTDGRHAAAASHHQKLVVVDGSLAFVGGMDICAQRWDSRAHRITDPRRTASGKPFPPKHDLQAFVTGRAAAALAHWFERQWRRAGHGRVQTTVGKRTAVPFEPTLSLPAGDVALSQTRARGPGARFRGVREVAHLYVSAILAAEKLIYIETQYFSARLVAQALQRRMRRRAGLEIVVILPRERETLEEATLVPAERDCLDQLRRQARRYRCPLGLYHPLAPDRGEGSSIQVHSKMMICDDLFLTIGSANLSNRSMSLDTELNVSWRAAAGQPLAGAIRDLRQMLLAEHTGADPETARGEFAEAAGLVARLDRHAASRRQKIGPYDSRPAGALPALGLHRLSGRPEVLT